MPRFASMIEQGMQERGHKVDVVTANPYFYNIPLPFSLKKWMGYIDQFILFPFFFRLKLANYPENTLFVFSDHALGPWVSLVANRPHVIHCHDFLAQLSAEGKIKGNKTGFTGRFYQQYIRRGYRKGKFFISVSQKTEKDLLSYLKEKPFISKVVYNGFNRPFHRLNKIKSREFLKQKTNLDLIDGFILHVGGNQWYKNRAGLIEIYSNWRKTSSKQLPLLMVGKKPDSIVLNSYNNSCFKKDIYFLADFDDEEVLHAYSAASLLLFPSLAEGFGWPIIEAMNCGCPVITTSVAPMTEVGGNAAFYIPLKPETEGEIGIWEKICSEMIEKIISFNTDQLEFLHLSGISNCERFNTDKCIDEIEEIYIKTILMNVKEK